MVAVSSSSGSRLGTNLYGVYGEPVSTNLGRFAYTGQIQLPGLSLYYYKARVYSPQLGRFLQTDPIGYEDQINLYAYVGNDPVNFVDATGKNAIALGAGAGCAVAGPACPVGAAVGALVGTGLTVACIFLCDDIINAVLNEAKPGITPEIPGTAVGEDPRPSRKPGGRTNSGPLAAENGGTGNVEEDFDILTGGRSGPAEEKARLPKGSLQGDNGVIYRPATDKTGPRIDIPAQEDKPHETLHYPLK